MAEADDWTPVKQPEPADDWEAVSRPPSPVYGNVSEAMPEAFVSRLRQGEAIARILQAAGKEAAHVPEGTPTGFENDTLNLLIEKGIFHDPLKSRPGPLQMANEAVMLPAAQAWQAIMRGTAMGIHGAGGLMGQLVEELGGSQGEGERAKRETINLGNWAMIEAGMGRFARPHVEAGKPMDRTVGTLPTEADFANAGKVLVPEPETIRAPAVRIGGEKVYEDLNHGLATEKAEKALGRDVTMDELESGFTTSTGRFIERDEAARIAKVNEDLQSSHLNRKVTEENLRRMWKEDGIHPAEAVHDAANDAFKKHEITAPPAQIDIAPKPTTRPAPSAPDPLDLAMEGKLSSETARGIADNLAKQQRDVEDAIFKGRADEWRKLNRQSDRAWNNADDAKAKAIDEKISRLEEEVGLTEADEAWLNGQGWDQFSVSDNWKELSQNLQDIENGRADAIGVVASEVRHLPKHNDWSKMYSSEQQSVITILTAMNVEKVAGRDPMTFLKEAFQERVRRYGGGADANEVAQYQMQELANLLRNPLNREKPIEVPRLTFEEQEILTETGGKPGSLSAAATEPPEIPLDVQPASPPGSIMGSLRAAGDSLFDMGRDMQMMVAPMARGTTDSMAMAKDFANAMRRNRWDWDRIHTDITKRFEPEQWKRMWNAMDEESLSLRLGEPESARAHQGLNTLTPEERAVVEDLDARQQLAWLRAVDLGMVEGEGIPMHAPRMVINVPNAMGLEPLPLDVIGRNLRTSTPSLRHRKYMEVEETERAAKEKYGMRMARELKSKAEIEAAVEKIEVLRDIRTVALSTAQLEDAIAGRTLINNIKAYGERSGTETVSEGAIPTGSETKWFTLDHPSFKTWRPKFNEGKVVKDAEGNVVFEQVPLYIHGDFEGPLRAVLDHRAGAMYGGMMALKGKTMSLIMNSPMIHNAVEWGRAVFAMPGKVATFKVYFEGNRAKNNVGLMHEAIDNGLVPIGHRFFNQDISGLAETPNLTPGRSWTAQILGAVPGLFDEAAGVAVKRAIDKAGDFWHNTLLWDRVADLQMGLYVNFRADMMAKGMDQATASKIAAHWANRYAGALPKEAMSDAATKVANMLLFSRSFTLGNMGVLKDMLTGLPKDVLAQIERDAGFRAGSVEAGIEAGEQAAGAAKALARRKAIAVVALDIAGMYVMNSLLQNMVNVMFNDSTVEKELHGYTARLKQALTEIGEHPLKLVQPFGFLEHVGATAENEPGRQERVRVGYAKDGTAIYARAPVGKIGEEFIGYMTGPLDMMRKKMGTIARPGWQILSNDAGFGRKIYDPTADTPAKYLQNAYLIAKHLALSQTPEGQVRALSDLVKGEGDAKVNAMQAFGPFAGVTFSKGAPGGPAVGEMYASKAQYEFRVNQALPDIRKQILRGDIDGAIGRMTELDIPQGLQRFYIRTTINPAARLSPRATRDFYLHSTPEQIQRFERALGQRPQP